MVAAAPAAPLILVLPAAELVLLVVLVVVIVVLVVALFISWITSSSPPPPPPPSSFCNTWTYNPAANVDGLLAFEFGGKRILLSPARLKALTGSDTIPSFIHDGG